MGQETMAYRPYFMGVPKRSPLVMELNKAKYIDTIYKQIIISSTHVKQILIYHYDTTKEDCGTTPLDCKTTGGRS